jgi:hypothetical protein
MDIVLKDVVEQFGPDAGILCPGPEKPGGEGILGAAREMGGGVVRVEWTHETSIGYCRA